MDPRFQRNRYLLRRKVLKIIGGEFSIWDDTGALVVFSRQKGWKLREDIRLYADETMTTELLNIQARKIVDWSAAYDVIDSVTGEKAGALKRKGWKSIAQDHWILMDANDQEIGEIKEDSMALAIVRRFINLIPQHYFATAGDKRMMELRQNFNPIVYKLTIDFLPDAGEAFDRRLGIAAAVLLAAIEGKQG